MIKTIHIIWIGDESKRPDENIQTWKDKNPGWDVWVWGNDRLANHEWINHKHIREMLKRGQYCGAADIMRYEILFEFGGLYVDADTVCKKPLEDWLFESNFWATWENEITRSGLVANTIIYCERGNELMRAMIRRLMDSKLPKDKLPWEITGPLFFTQTWRDYEDGSLTIYPSHFFLPRHFTGQVYTGTGHVFGEHQWGTTRGSY